jgi:hypothetical protein
VSSGVVNGAVGQHVKTLGKVFDRRAGEGELIFF